MSIRRCHRKLARLNGKTVDIVVHTRYVPATRRVRMWRFGRLRITWEPKP